MLLEAGVRLLISVTRDFTHQTAELTHSGVVLFRAVRV